MKCRIPCTNWLWRAFIPMMLIVMFLIPKTVLAENALSWETYAQKVRIQEEAKGIYADWDIADKQALIESLIQMNAMSDRPPRDVCWKEIFPQKVSMHWPIRSFCAF